MILECGRGHAGLNCESMPTKTQHLGCSTKISKSLNLCTSKAVCIKKATGESMRGRLSLIDSVYFIVLYVSRSDELRVETLLGQLKGARAQ